jgi:hypothetical protein
MFKLIQQQDHNSELSRVEDLVLEYDLKLNTYTHLIYCDGHVEYSSMLKNTAPEYFTYQGWHKYIHDNLEKIKFIDGHAVYQMINLPMIKNEHYIDISLLKDQNKQLTQQVVELQMELKMIQEVNLFTNVLFSGVYPTWENETEFKALKDYKYISLVLDKVVVSFDHNFHISYVYGHTIPASSSKHSSTDYSSSWSCKVANECANLNNEFIISWSRPKFLIPFSYGPWCDNMICIHYTNKLIIEDIFKKNESSINDSVHMYIIGVIAGWIHLNLDKILLYEYLIFIDCDENGTSFKLITTKKHTLLPKRFLYDWRRFIVNGVKQ